LRDLTRRGAYIETTERWYVGTIVSIVIQLEEDDPAGENTQGRKPDSISLKARVVSHGEDGVAVQFVFFKSGQREDLKRFLKRVSNDQAIGRPIEKKEVTEEGKALNTVRRIDQQLKSEGQALVEFALVLPLLLILIVNIVNFAGFFNAFVAVGNASRSAGDYTIMGSIAYSGTDASGNAGPTLTAPSDSGSAGAQLVANMLGTDMLALKNRSTINVRLCRLNPSSAAISNATCNVCNNSAGTGTMSCTSGSGSFTSNPSPDTSTGEGSNYTLTWVDVSYTYSPFIPIGFTFPGLGFGVTLPSNLVIHRQSVYRVLN
jgi:hypothetical protein